MDLEKRSVEEFTCLIASKAPYPGGGGACAAVAAIGIALGSMVAELTIGKPAYAQVEEEMLALNEKAKNLRAKFVDLINKDAEGFEPLSKAYRLPKDAPNRDAIMEDCLRQAAKAPLDVFDACCEAIEILGPFAKKGSKLAVSDAATGVEFALAALKGAAVNVKVNTGLMKDRQYAKAIEEHLAFAMEKYEALAVDVFDSIYNNL